MKHFAIYSINQGNCRVYYTSKADDGHKVLYCLYDDKPEIRYKNKEGKIK